MKQITPGEFHLKQDNPVIRTKCPPDKIDNAMIVKRVKNANLSAGDHILVQCFDHKLEQLIGECEYIVLEAVESLRTVEASDYDIRQLNETLYTVQMFGEWWFPAKKKAEKAA